MREYFSLMYSGKGLPLAQILQLFATLYPDRLIILNKALDAAAESDAHGFSKKDEAFALVYKLATTYWEILEDGGSDTEARDVFGNNKYASQETDKLSTEGQKRRTVLYSNRPYFLQKHLKIGIKDSKAETLRIHFEWLAEEKKILIGHCGKHLPL